MWLLAKTGDAVGVASMSMKMPWVVLPWTSCVGTRTEEMRRGVGVQGGGRGRGRKKKKGRKRNAISTTRVLVNLASVFFTKMNKI